MSATSGRNFTLEELSDEAGVSPKKLSKWLRKGYITAALTPEGEPIFSYEDTTVVTCLAHVKAVWRLSTASGATHAAKIRGAGRRDKFIIANKGEARAMGIAGDTYFDTGSGTYGGVKCAADVEKALLNITELPGLHIYDVDFFTPDMGDMQAKPELDESTS